MYSLLLALIYLAFMSLGLPDSLLGSGWPVMYRTLNVAISYMGIVCMVISGGTIVSSLCSDRLTKKFGTRAVTVVSVFLTTIALFGFSLSNQFWILILFAIPFGLGAGAIDAALNNYVALHYTAKHMSWLHCFWGVGTIISPFVMSYALVNSTWNNGYRIVAFLQFGIGMLLLVTLPVWKVNQNNVVENTKSIGLFSALKIKGVPYLLIGFFAYCAAEATAMYWASTYMVEVKNIVPEQAAKFASLFYIGITIGRFLCGFIMNKLGDRKMIILGTGILFCGVLSLLIPTQNSLVSLVAFVIIGFGCAPIYPCIIHSTPENFGADNSGAIIGIQMASAYVGTTFIPPLFGFLGHIINFKILPMYLILFFALMIVMTELTFRVTAKRKIDSIIFDVDGTIWDTTEVVANAWNKAVEDCNITDIRIDAKRLQGLFGLPMEDIVNELLPDVPEETRRRFKPLCFNHEKEFLVETPGKVYPGMEDTLRELSKVLPLFVVSNCQSGYIELMFEKTGFGKYFIDHTCYGDTDMFKADNIKLIINKHNLKNPLYVGDTQMDADACIEAKVPIVYAAYGFGSVKNADYEITNVNELKNIVK